MSRKKHSVAFIKPDEPKFLRDLKIQAGYKEGPTVDTKRAELPEATEEDFEDREEEKPVVVVLNTGDLTAEEANAFQKQKEEEEANAPADLSKPIIFRKIKSSSKESNETDSPVIKKPKKEQKKIILSFNDDDEEEED
ncbi:uncharacterized protein KIAA1143 homolog [Leptopilina boulardi]|uniref:uncharacterized protein KIAA1143 homolog n=1 Tax=Leptopilina boulardi TaxID=63433 RepID=UPI0021F5D153|nr:uncharacterized protein KIAA1143 homolog [Leptopilina boulardi]